ncbi:MAG: hypothetical protein P0Y53_08860 [Candidatus Pseudobacter hemicellulosilyticus]|uniref:Uncharacterized protein n=1 Tax=Candidatus Pseudobacter hemicellulosilyticus TaxID=3121375 RepID=A0AAJ6BJP4_9BACT|nr:MAG: hypothetical protein P0Y53_08860 [Pseudobacter sp.]
MKNRYTGLVVFLFVFTHVNTSAQEALTVPQFIPVKPLLFSKLPQRSVCRQSALEAPFQSAAGDTVKVELSGQVTFHGTITEKVRQSPVLVSLNLQSLDSSGAMLHLTRLQLPGKAPQYKARLLHPASGDVLVLTRQDDQYLLVKKAQKFILPD